MTERASLSFVKFKQSAGGAKSPASKGTSGWHLEYFRHDRNTGLQAYDLTKSGDTLIIRDITTGQETLVPWANVQSATAVPPVNAAQKGPGK